MLADPHPWRGAKKGQKNNNNGLWTDRQLWFNRQHAVSAVKAEQLEQLRIEKGRMGTQGAAQAKKEEDLKLVAELKKILVQKVRRSMWYHLEGDAVDVLCPARLLYFLLPLRFVASLW